MKILFFIIFQIITSVFLFSQNSWEKLINTNKDEILSSAIELNNGNLIFCGNRDLFYSPYKSYSKNEYLLKTDKFGNIIKEKEIQKTDTFIDRSVIYKLNNSSFLVFSETGKYSYPFSNILMIQKFDTSFNLIFKKLYKIPLDSVNLFNYKFTRNFHGNIIIAGSTVYDKEDVWFNMYFWEFNTEGDSINSHFFSESPNNWRLSYNFLEKKDTSGYYCLTKRPWTQALTNRILKVNYNLQVTDSADLPVSIDNDGEIKWFNDSTIIISGIYNILYKNKYQSRDLGIITIDTSFNTFNYNHFGIPDTEDVMTTQKSLIYEQGDMNIFIAGISNYNLSTDGFSHTPSSILLIKTDLNLNPVFEKYYKGDACYYTKFFKKTNDNGFLFLSTRYDYQTQNNERDIFILKVDSLGNLPASVDNPEFTVHDLLLYPNPGKDILQIRTGTQSTGGILKLFDITRKDILQTKIREANTTVNTSSLPAGIYIYTYTLNGKTIETGKWIKK